MKLRRTLTLPILLAYGALSALLYRRLSRPKRIFGPDAVPSIDFEDVRFPSRGPNDPVYAFYLPGEPDFPAIISVHGYNMSRHSGYHLLRANALRSLGYTVLSLDLGGNGGDTRRDGHITMGYRERFDVLGAFDYLIDRGFSSSRIGIVSESMGAATTLSAVALEPRIRAVWADSPYTDVTSILNDQIGIPVLSPLLTLGVMGIGMLLYGDKMWEVRPIEAAQELAANRQAVYLVATRGDTVVKFKHGQALYVTYRAAGVDVSFWDIPDLLHAEALEAYYNEYLQRIDQFFARTLKR